MRVFLIFVECMYCLDKFNKWCFFFFFFKCSAPTSLHLQRIPKQLCVALCLSDFFFPLFLSETGSWGFWPHLDLSQCQEVVCSKRFHDTDLFPIYQIARSVNKVSTVFFHSCEITNGLLWGLIIKSFEFFFQGKSIIFRLVNSIAA